MTNKEQVDKVAHLLCEHGVCQDKRCTECMFYCTERAQAETLVKNGVGIFQWHTMSEEKPSRSNYYLIIYAGYVSEIKQVAWYQKLTESFSYPDREYGDIQVPDGEIIAWADIPDFE